LCYSVIEGYGDTKMKQFIINHSLQLVTDIYPDYDSSKLDEIRYGLEAIYLSLTKVVVILLVSLLLGLFKEAVILLFFFNGLRSFAFGIHATKGWMCWIASSLLFIGLPYVCLHLNMPLVIQYFVLAVTFICFLLYAPADTKKRPLVRKNRRIKFKLLTITVAVIYILLYFYTNSMFLKNVIMWSMLLEAVLIHPLTYRVFKLPYKNYEGYVFSK
jgi:accessory gene regulator B